MKLAHRRDLYGIYTELVSKHLLTPRLTAILLSQVPHFPREVLSLARLLNRKLPESLEQVIAGDPRSSYFYAKDILQGPFPLGEEVIALDAEYAFTYARGVLKGPFLQGEPVIAQDAMSSWDYARHVLKAPFLAGELAIVHSGFDGYRKDYYDQWYRSVFPTLRDWENSVLRRES